MEKRIVYLALLVIGFAFFPTSCKRDLGILDAQDQEWKLPPETCERTGNFGFLLDGRVVLANGLNSLRAYYYATGPYAGTLSIDADNKGHYELNEAFSLALHKEVFSAGTYSLDSLNQLLYSVRPWGIGGSYTNYRCYNGMYGEINIKTIDTTNRKVCGTFEMDMINESDNTDTIRIRRGRFDLEYVY